MKLPYILTFNWHESYVHLLAKTGYEFDVVERWKGGRYGWVKEFRPVPSNCHLISEDEARGRLKSGSYDRIIAHNINDLLFVKECLTPKVLIFHNKLSTEIALGGKGVDKNEYLGRLRQLFDTIKNLSLVFISRAKRDDWGLDGEIILPGIDPSEYNGYAGDVGKALRVGNLLIERDIMLGYSLQERVLSSLPSTVLGLNPNIAVSQLPKDWEEFKDFLKNHRVYLNSTLDPYEDGYNLAMLEVMTTGMPVVSIANLSSPIEDGINGFVSADEGYLRSRIEELLINLPLAKSLGKRARETVMDRFPMERFIRDWKRVIGDSVSLSFPEQTTVTESMDAKDRGYFSQERKDIEALIPEDTMRILEVGCGEGILGKRLLKKGAKEVIGIEINPEICRRSVRNLSGIVCGDIEELELPFAPQFFNCIIFADVLEHLRDPQLALKKLKNYLSPSGTVVASIPNVRYYGVIDMLVEGRWKYEDCGILDKTHLRFFTKKEIESLFNGAGLEIIGITENIDPAYYNLNDPLSGEISFGRVSLKGLLPEELKDLFVVQYLIKAQKTGHEIQKVHDAVKSAVEAGNLEEANRAFEEYLEPHPADTDILYGHADVCYKLGLLDEAMESLERILLFEPERKDALELRKKIIEEVNANEYL